MLIAYRTIETDHNDRKSILLGVTQGSLAFQVFPARLFAKAAFKFSDKRHGRPFACHFGW